MEKLTAADVPPPGFGLVTVTAIVPPVATSELITPTASTVELEYPVGRGEPLKFTTDPGTNPLPVSTKSEPGGGVPIFVVFGAMEVSLGTGFVAGPTGSLTDGEARPGVLVCTAISASDSVAKSSAGIVAVSARGEPPDVVFS